MGKGIAVSFKTKFGGVDELKSQGTFNIVIYFNLSIYTDSSTIFSVMSYSGWEPLSGVKNVLVFNHKVFAPDYSLTNYLGPHFPIFSSPSFLLFLFLTNINNSTTSKQAV